MFLFLFFRILFFIVFVVAITQGVDNTQRRLTKKEEEGGVLFLSDTRTHSLRSLYIDILSLSLDLLEPGKYPAEGRQEFFLFGRGGQIVGARAESQWIVGRSYFRTYNTRS